MDTVDMDHNFEPQFRARSNTWPLRPSRDSEIPNQNDSPGPEDPNVAELQGKQADPLGLTAKKSGSRRNAWGNLSYADLITKAIQSSADKRLTLSQIYDWMVQNVPYFKDKGDSTSSAGWKNSIRHNLSLHSRFMRIQNEGTGKSSWWVINPDAKPGKAPRRRAGSMETKTSVAKRGRLNKLKKRVEAIRADMKENGESALASMDYLDALAFEGFRSRANSSASSCGRLSPIQAAQETDLNDNQVPPMSPIPWGTETDDLSELYRGRESYPDLVESLVEGMKLSGQESMDMTTSLNSDSYLSSNVSQDFSNSPQNSLALTESLNESGQFSGLPAPPPYPGQSAPSPAATTEQCPMTTEEQLDFTSTTLSGQKNGLKSSFNQPTLYSESVNGTEQLGSPGLLSVSIQSQPLGSPDRSQQNSPNQQTFSVCVSPQVYPTNTQKKARGNPQLSSQQLRALLDAPLQNITSPVKAQQQHPAVQQGSDSILRKALTGVTCPFSLSTSTSNTHLVSSTRSTASPDNVNSLSNMLKLGGTNQQHQLQQQQQLLRLASKTGNSLNETSTVSRRNLSNSFTCTNNQINSNNNMPLDIDADSLISLDFDMDQVIKQELSLEGNLDFNFDNFNLPASASS